MAALTEAGFEVVKNVGIIVLILASGVSLFLSLRRERRERTILKFSLMRTLVAEGPEDNPGEISDSIRAFLTNQGSRPITIHCIELDYSYKSKAGNRQVRGSACVNGKIGQGDALTAYVLINREAFAFHRLQAVDSTGKCWRAPGRKLASLGKEPPGFISRILRFRNSD